VRTGRHSFTGVKVSLSQNGRTGGLGAPDVNLPAHATQQTLEARKRTLFATHTDQLKFEERLSPASLALFPFLRQQSPLANIRIEESGGSRQVLFRHRDSVPSLGILPFIICSSCFRASSPTLRRHLHFAGSPLSTDPLAYFFCLPASKIQNELVPTLPHGFQEPRRVPHL
jgi:hypothetical protein